MEEQVTALSENHHTTGRFTAAKETTMRFLPVSTLDRDLRMFKGIEHSFPGRMEWVVLSNGKIEMGISQDEYRIIKETTRSKTNVLSYLKFAITKNGKTGKGELISSPKMMILNEQEVNVQLDGLIDGRLAAIRYECLPKAGQMGKTELFARIDLAGSVLQTSALLDEGMPAELGTISRGTDTYTIYVAVQQKRLEVKGNEKKI